MVLESSSFGRESAKTTEVTRVVGKITEEIKLLAEQSEFFSEPTRQLIMQAVSAGPQEVMSDLLDESRRYRGTGSTEQQVRQFFANKIVHELEDTLESKDVPEKEKNALVLFLRYNVLNLRPQQ